MSVAAEREGSRFDFELSSFTVAKSASTPNEDRVAVSDDRRKVAVSDGASISYDSARWADILVRRYVAQSDLTANWLKDARAEFELAVEREALPWHEQAAFDRGSSATLLGITIEPENAAAQILAVGDSVAIILHEGRWLTSHPYEDAAEFDRTPDLLSSAVGEGMQLPLNEGTAILPLHLAEYLGRLDILLMTDALGVWCLRNRDEGIARLLTLPSSIAFETLVENERANGAMRRDDTTLVILTRRARNDVPADY